MSISLSSMELSVHCHSHLHKSPEDLSPTMSITLNFSSPSSSSSFSQLKKPHLFTSNPSKRSQLSLFIRRASRRVSITNSNNANLVDDPRIWSRSINNELFDDEIHDEEDDEEEKEDRSLDLLVRFIQNVFKKISKRAKKAVRSVLPPSISTKLVGFSVNGVLMLAFLWVLKAFLEVVCTLGSAVFVSILLIRGIWSGITYIQESRYLKLNELDEDHSWSSTRRAAT